MVKSIGSQAQKLRENSGLDLLNKIFKISREACKQKVKNNRTIVTGLSMVINLI